MKIDTTTSYILLQLMSLEVIGFTEYILKLIMWKILAYTFHWDDINWIFMLIRWRRICVLKKKILSAFCVLNKKILKKWPLVVILKMLLQSIITIENLTILGWSPYSVTVDSFTVERRLWSRSWTPLGDCTDAGSTLGIDIIVVHIVHNKFNVMHRLFKSQ